MKKIAIVEDEKSLAQAYKTILENHGYEVFVAYDGEEALEVVEKHSPDLVLLDLKMPRMNGLEFLRHLKQNTTTKIIVFSNQDTQTDIDEAFRLGAKHYLLKSWAAPQDLVKVVREGLKG
jgi:two-component system, OmpR family, response regulator VicR